MTNSLPTPGVQIDANDSVLVLIDYMPTLMLACQTMEPEKLTSNAVAPAEIGAAFDLPILTTGGRTKDPFLPEVIAACGTNRQHVERHSVDCFESQTFVDAVNKTGRKSIVFAGITTDLCVMQPALTARARGFNVQVVVDASACFTRQIEEVSLLRLQQAGVTLTTWVMLASEFHRASNWQEGVGPNLMKTFQTHHGATGLIGTLTSAQ